MSLRWLLTVFKVDNIDFRKGVVYFISMRSLSVVILVAIFAYTVVLWRTKVSQAPGVLGVVMKLLEHFVAIFLLAVTLRHMFGMPALNSGVLFFLIGAWLSVVAYELPRLRAMMRKNLREQEHC